MRINKLTNTSSEKLIVRTSGGVKMEVDPGQSVRYIIVENYDEIKTRVKATMDLTEVQG